MMGRTANKKEFDVQRELNYEIVEGKIHRQEPIVQSNGDTNGERTE